MSEPTYRQCFKCERKYTLERWRQLELHGFHPFGKNFLEMRRCSCEIIISVEHVLHVDLKALPAYQKYTRYEGNRRRF